MTMFQRKVVEEGKKEEELHEKVMCYCKNRVSDSEGTIAAAKSKIASPVTESKALVERKAQTEGDLEEHQPSRADTKEARASATTLREKEASAYANSKADSDANIVMRRKAIAAIASGMAVSIIQTTAARFLENYSASLPLLPAPSSSSSPCSLSSLLMLLPILLLLLLAPQWYEFL